MASPKTREAPTNSIGGGVVTDRCFFFGCWNRAGHFLFGPGGRSLTYAEAKKIEHYGHYVHIDGNLAPRRDTNGSLCWAGMWATQQDRQRIGFRSVEYAQGQFLLHHLDTGFTAMSWWDRTHGDTRPGCNSTVLLEGRHTAEEMLVALEKHFPHVLANLTKAGIALVEVKLP